jgi:hypothetical protein
VRPRRSDFRTREAYLQALYEAGEAPVDAQGRARFDFVGEGPYARWFQAVAGPARPPRVKRVSDGLDARDYMKLYKAVALANLHGVNLNTYATITWSLQGVTADEAVAEVHCRFLDLYRRWCCADSSPGWPKLRHAVIWTLERGSRRGVHSNLLLHVPERARFKFTAWARRAIKGLTGQPLVMPDSMKAQGEATLFAAPLVGGRGRPSAVDQQWQVLKYITKGITEQGLAKILADQSASYLVEDYAQGRLAGEGRIVGKRCGVSRSLDAAAQAKYEARYGFPLCWPGECWEEAELVFGERFLEVGRLQRDVRNLDV